MELLPVHCRDRQGCMSCVLCRALSEYYVPSRTLSRLRPDGIFTKNVSALLGLVDRSLVSPVTYITFWETGINGSESGENL